MVVVVLDKLSSVERKKFEREKGTYRLYEKRGKTRVPIKVKGLHVMLIYRREFDIIKTRRGTLWAYM